MSTWERIEHRKLSPSKRKEQRNRKNDMKRNEHRKEMSTEERDHKKKKLEQEKISTGRRGGLKTKRAQENRL